MSTPAKRALFTTPSRSTKRRKTMAKRGAGRFLIPRSLVPETKFHSDGVLGTSTTNYAYQSIPISILSGSGTNARVGAKIRILRMRVMYDFSQISLTEAVRISVVIPKDPSTTPALGNAITPWDTNSFTVLFDRLLGDDTALVSGTFDVKGPLNVDYASTGNTCLRNNVYVYVQSAGQAAAMRLKVTVATWYTDN